MKICIFDKKPYSLEKDGKTYTGFNYQGFREDGKGIKFSSKVDHDVEEVEGYDEEIAKEISLRPRINDKGGISYREEVSF